jgi:ABC-type branched-subunit amino acid transport system substrate-binding protein
MAAGVSHLRPRGTFELEARRAMKKVFISYRREDSAATCGRIYDRLVATFGKDSVFKDVDNIPLGVNFANFINQVIGQCSVLLAVIGPGWLDARAPGSRRRRLEDSGDFVRLEIEAAFARGIPVVPVLVQNAAMPAAKRLPPSLRPLALQNGSTVRYDPDFDTDVRRLIAALQQIPDSPVVPMGAPAVPGVTAPPPPVQVAQPVFTAPPAAPPPPRFSPPGGAPVPQPAGRLQRAALYVAVGVIVLSLAGLGIFGRGLLSNGGRASSTPPGSGTGTSSSITNQHFKSATELPVSGTDASVALPVQYGVDLAISQNLSLGNGNTLDVVHMDDEGTSGGGDPIQGMSNVQQLISDQQVMGIVGPFTSGVAIKELPLINAATLVEISPSNENPGLTLQQYAASYGISYATLHPSGKPDAYLRIAGNDVVQGKADATLALSGEVNCHSAYVVDDNTSYGSGLASYFTTSFTAAGGTIVGTRATITADQSGNLPQLAASIKSSGATCVFFGGVTSQGISTLKKDLVAIGYTRPLVVGDGVTEDPAFTQIAGSAAAYTFGTIPAPDSTTLPASFTSAYNTFVQGKPDNTLNPSLQ